MFIIHIFTTLLLLSGLSRSEDDLEPTLIDYTDGELEQEVRRRWFGGPWQAEDAVSILNLALDIATKPNRPSRARRFENEAKQILQILTDEEDPFVEAPDALESKDDPDYLDDPIVVGSGYSPSLKTIQKIVDMHDGTNGERRRTGDGITKLYDWYRPNMLPRFRKRLLGSRPDKLRALDSHTFKVFKDARNKRSPIHGRMIQRWARQQAVTIGLEEFFASDSWLTKFKRRHGIVSRKVTIYTDRSEQEDLDIISESIKNFTEKYKQVSVPFDQSLIWNFDQTGFNYEPANLRTLSFKGERDTSIQLDAKNKHTHSYTAQPMISRDGKLFPKLLLVTREPEKGTFGPIVGRRVAQLEEKYGNIEVYASKSGKLDKYLIHRWFNNTLRPAIQAVKERRMIEDQDEAAVLILADAWGGHSNKEQELRLNSMGAELMQIPKKTTDRLQPLDVNFNRQLKIFYNRVIEEAFYQDVLHDLTSKEGIINLHSLIHNQFSSEKYRDMIRYAWKNTDPAFNRSEMVNHPPKMVNAIQFEFDYAGKCSKEGCDKHAFVKCSHCGRLLCLHHFINRTCFHTNQGQRITRDVSDDTCNGDVDSCDLEEAPLEPASPSTTETSIEQSNPLDVVSKVGAVALGAVGPHFVGVVAGIAVMQHAKQLFMPGANQPAISRGHTSGDNVPAVGHSFTPTLPDFEGFPATSGSSTTTLRPARTTTRAASRQTRKPAANLGRNRQKSGGFGRG